MSLYDSESQTAATFADPRSGEDIPLKDVTNAVQGRSVVGCSPVPVKTNVDLDIVQAAKGTFFGSVLLSLVHIRYTGTQVPLTTTLGTDREWHPIQFYATKTTSCRLHLVILFGGALEIVTGDNFSKRSKLVCSAAMLGEGLIRGRGEWFTFVCERPL